MIQTEKTCASFAVLGTAADMQSQNALLGDLRTNVRGAITFGYFLWRLWEYRVPALRHYHDPLVEWNFVREEQFAAALERLPKIDP